MNRHGIEAQLSTELDRALRNRHSLSALLIDIDHFKSINDSAGHAAGDDALRFVSKGISSSLRSYDLVGRYGGDEFLLLLPETTANQACEVAERIRNLLNVAAQTFAPALRPTVSIGIAQTLQNDTIITLLARADAALYDAKHAGRNCVRKRDSSGVHPIFSAGQPEAVQEEAAARRLSSYSFEAGDQNRTSGHSRIRIVVDGPAGPPEDPPVLNCYPDNAGLKGTG